MALSLSAINLIGRTHPEIFEILGNPVGPYARAAVDRVAINPQPLPPAFAAGLRAGSQLTQLAFTADRLRLALDLDADDWCGTPPNRPPFVWPPEPWPPRGVDPRLAGDPESSRWTDYHLGLAVSLEATAHLWGSLADAGAIAHVAEVALGTAAKLAG